MTLQDTTKTDERIYTREEVLEMLKLYEKYGRIIASYTPATCEGNPNAIPSSERLGTYIKPLNAYLRDLRKHPLLSREAEGLAELIRGIRRNVKREEAKPIKVEYSVNVHEAFKKC